MGNRQFPKRCDLIAAGALAALRIQPFCMKKWQFGWKMGGLDEDGHRE
jgi:hypothetical protein